MSTYPVRVRYRIPNSIVIEVEADSEAQAIERACAEVEGGLHNEDIFSRIYEDHGAISAPRDLAEIEEDAL